MADKIFVDKYVPEYVPQGLKWYERDGLMVYIDQLNYQRVSEDPDGYLKKSDVVNFDIINSQIRGTARQIMTSTMASTVRPPMWEEKCPKKRGKKP